MKYFELISEKDVVCDICGKKIEKGNPYAKIESEPDDWNLAVEYLEYGPFQTFSRHTDCDKAWKMISDALGDGELFCYFYDGGAEGMAFESLQNDEIDSLNFADPDLIHSFFTKLGLYEIWNRQREEKEDDEE